MICSNCGKDISFVGKVCPYCHVDKTKQAARHVAFVGGGALGSAIGFWVVGCSGWFIGGLIGAGLGFAGCLLQDYQGKLTACPTPDSPDFRSPQANAMNQRICAGLDPSTVKFIAWTVGIFAVCWLVAGLAIWTSNRRATANNIPAFLRDEPGIHDLIKEMPPTHQNNPASIEAFWTGRSYKKRILNDSIATIFQGYDEDPQAADERYKGKRLFLLGFVNKITRNQSGDPSVQLLFQEEGERWAECSLPHRFDLSWVHHGDFLYADGELVHRTNRTIFVKCWRVFSPDHLSAILDSVNAMKKDQ